MPSDVMPVPGGKYPAFCISCRYLSNSILEEQSTCEALEWGPVLWGFLWAVGGLGWEEDRRRGIVKASFGATSVPWDFPWGFLRTYVMIFGRAGLGL